MATIIDALLVTLGIDVSDYKRGEADAAKATVQTGQKLTAEQKKQADARKRVEDEQRKRAKQTADEEKKRADATVKGFKDIAIGAAGMVLGFESIKGFVSLLGTLNSNEAGLGRLGQNLGVNVHELNTWGLAAERIGGKAEDVQASFANVSKSITELSVNAQVSPLFLLAQRMGLDIQHVTDKTKFLLDLGDKLRAYGAAHGRDNAFNISGLDATTFNLITADDARKRLADAEAANHVNEQTAAAAADSQARIEKIKQRASNIARDVSHAITAPAVDFVDKSMTATGYQLEGLNAAAHGDWKVAWERFKNSAGHGVIEDRGELDEGLTRAEQYVGLAPGTLHTIAQIESGMDPTRVNKKSGAAGLMQLMPNLFPDDKDPGKDTFKDMDTAAKEFARLVKHFNGDYVKAAEAYNFGQGRLDAFLAGKADPKTGKVLTQLPEETRRYAERFTAAVGATPGLARTNSKATTGGSEGGNTTVNVGAVTVNTAATDANGVAAGLAGAVKRQSYTAQANTGQTQ
jgi:soluble lytic murein transglycosylase-like protein